jgi:hypothetical protein
MPIERYGAKFEDGTSDLVVEMECIRAGGRWMSEKTGKQCGEGLPFHYERVRNILWPHLDDHRWHRLCRDTILANKFTTLLGCASSGKTNEASWIYLVEYMCFPDELFLGVSSTHIEGLRLRAWGEITSLWQMAKDAYPDVIPGHLLDSKLFIATDKIDDKDMDERRVRDWRKGIKGIPCIQNGKFVGLGKFCFRSGTLVDTPTGPISIEQIRPGDVVWSAAGAMPVEATFKRPTDTLLRIHLTNGQSIECTPEHPFLTQLGWVNAIDISTQHELISTDEAMYCLQEGYERLSRDKEILFQEVPAQHLGKALCSVQNEIYSVRAARNFLFQTLFCEVDMETARLFGQGESGPRLRCDRKENQRDTSSQSEGVETSQRQYQEAASRNAEKSYARRVWRRPLNDEAGKSNFGSVSESGLQSLHSDRQKFTLGRRPPLLSGLRVAGHKTECGSRWVQPSGKSSTAEGRQKNQVFERKRVDRIEVLERGSDARYNEGQGGYTVHNIQVAGHPSYSVNGCLVHNCGIKQKRIRLIADEAQYMSISFLSAFSNLETNGDFRAVVLGNPNDPIDPLGKASEPVDGWAGHMEPTKTTTWKTKMLDGMCVNLIGTDSPNFDQEKELYPYLIKRKNIERTEAFFGKDSFEYNSQCVGSMKVSSLARRVITRDMCIQFGATEDVKWKGTSLTKIYGVDAAYGGDRCVGGAVEFGEDIDGKIVLNVHAPKIIPVKASKESAEDQIAAFVFGECTTMGIPPENMYHDATGRGSLGTALARIWSAMTNPVEFGGNPTDRPVSLDLFIYDDKSRQRRLKLCNEHYSKFVTELWFSVRYAIEAGQIRNLPEDVMDEGCMREWDMVKGDKIEVETKLKMKERTGRSPDLFDWLSICVEGARRRGFQVSKLANQEHDSFDNTEWSDLRERQGRFRRESELDYKA